MRRSYIGYFQKLMPFFIRYDRAEDDESGRWRGRRPI